MLFSTRMDDSRDAAHAWGAPFPFNEPGRPTSCHRQRCMRCGALAIRRSGAGRSATLLLKGQPVSCVTVPVEAPAPCEPPGATAESVPAEPVSSAVEVLADAPPWWSPCVEG
jgi:hypothetical protein